jgi:alkanesulfonate monooxygenase SsuD/methylene tetrahydromethanopterin reductase-like flavin-dependent oxidoreductase (luciferase family)
MVQFGVFDHIEHVPGIPLDELYRDRLVQLEALDEAGFYAYHLAEHHTPAVHSMAPSQNVFLAAVSQRTEFLRFGPGVYVLPLHHPLRLIEEISMLDNISGGRMEIGVGRGGVLEAYFWGQDSDPETNAARYDETLEVVKQGLSHDVLEFHGRFYDFEEVPMRLRPKQSPHPPLWYMRNPETAARGGMNCIVVGSLDTLEANVMRYRRIWREEHGDGALTLQGTQPKIGLVVHVVLAANLDVAVERAEPAWEKYRWNLGTPRRLEAERRKLTQFLAAEGTGGGNRRGPERHLALEERRDLDASLEDLTEEERAARDRRRAVPGPIPGVLVGTPDTVTQFMDEYVTTGADYFVCSFQFGNLSHEAAMESIELWRREIMPRYGTTATTAGGSR